MPLTTPGVTSGNPITHVSIVKGRFNTLSQDQLAVAFATNSGPSTVEIIDFKTNSLIPTEGPQLSVSTVTIPTGYLQVKVGQFASPGNPYDQIVFHMSSTSANGKFFEVLSANPIDLTLTAHSPVTYNQLPCAAPDGVQIGNFDHQQPDPTKPGSTEHDPNSQIAFLACSANAVRLR